ncbi:MAG TPA: hypothetical protein VM619_14685 [Luteimonas sp.]|nr:hypothetical protein [Luteimonas sp.]
MKLRSALANSRLTGIFFARPQPVSIDDGPAIAEDQPEVEETYIGHIQIGNQDIATPAWQPPARDPERPVLPGHEHQLDERSRIEVQRVAARLAATERRVMAMFDDIAAQMDRIAAQMRADGLFRDAASRTRQGDLH